MVDIKINLENNWEKVQELHSKLYDVLNFGRSFEAMENYAKRETSPVFDIHGYLFDCNWDTKVKMEEIAKVYNEILVDYVMNGVKKEES